MATLSGMNRVSDTVWEIPQSFKEGMRVPARIYATEKLVREMDDGVVDQVTNVATLPGIVNYACCMPDAHWGYGFPIGGVAATDADEGVISPGGVVLVQEPTVPTGDVGSQEEGQPLTPAQEKVRDFNSWISFVRNVSESHSIGFTDLTGGTLAVLIKKH